MPEQEDTTMDTADSSERDQQVLSDVMGVVRDCLARLKAGDLFMDGLGKECYDRLQSAITTKDDKGTEILTPEFEKFMGVIADVLAREASGDGDGDGDDESPENAKRQKKIKKKWTKFLRANFECVEQEINNYDTNNAASGATTSQENGSQPRAKDESSSRTPNNELADSNADAEGKEAADMNADADDLDGDDNTSYSSASHGRLTKKSKKKKRKGKDKDKKRKKKKRKRAKLDEAEDESDAAADGDDQSNADFQEVDTKDSRDRMEEFVRKREETLSKVPEEVKGRFRQPGFSNWSKKWLPVLEMGPFDVPPGVVRDQWFAMFENCHNSGRELTRIVYWYGTEALEEAYSFQPAKKIVTYEEGLQRGYGDVPATIRRKQQKENPKLTKSESQILMALGQIKLDADLEPSERADWLPEWEEAEEDTKEDAEEEDMSVDSPVKKNKKHKKKDKGDEKKKPKKKKKKDKGGAQVEDKVEESADDVEMAVNTEEETAVAEEPKDFDYASAEEKDEAFSDDVKSDSEGDEDFVEAKKRKSKAGKASSSRKKKSQLTAEEEVDQEEKSAKKREIDRKKRGKKRKPEAGDEIDEPAAKKPPKKKGKTSKAEEQRRFDKCEDIFLPIIQRLKRALKADDLEACDQCVKGFKENVEMTTPSFIRHHQFGLFVKESRKKFKSKGRDDLVNLCHELTKDLKRVFNEKEASVPEGFEPKIRKVKKEGASEKKRPKVEEGTSAAESSKSRQAVKSEDDAQTKESAIPKKEDENIPGKASGPSTVEPMEQVQVMAPQPSKPARKPAFSLSKMFEKPKKAPTPKARVPDRVPVAADPKANKQIPAWLTGPTPPDNAMPQEDERSLGIEFLQDAFVLFPPDKVNIAASSLALESAIFDWSTRYNSQTGVDRSEAYWEKIHDIVAAFVGKKESGSLIQKILEGGIACDTPRDLLRITRKKLNSFFEGHSV